ncbi:hypothetical protein SLS56_008764 [Neofusicoccum ribis]|uniref:AAA+ ATPase domain-containing protein n=1 Tax=Neofusicoccum ribis TaxID=45134 RepID=A0ABR3SJ61_9PEZI
MHRPDEGHGQPDNVPEALDLEVRPKSSSSTSETPESPTPTSKSPEEPQTDVPAITEESEPAPQSTSQLPSSTLHRPLTPEHSVSEYSVSASFLSTSPTASVTSDESLATASVQGGIPVSAPGKPASQPTTEVLDNVAAQRPVTAEGSASVISRSSSQYLNDKDPGNCLLDDRSLDTTRLPDDEQLNDEPTPVDVPAQAATTETDHPQFFASNEMRKREPELGAASPGTCAWCFDSDTYKTWKSQGGLLCIKGKPGAGKTTLMRRIIEQLQLDPQQKSCIASYSFQGATTDSQKPMSGLFHAIVHQLAQESGQPSELMSLSSLDKRSDAIGDFSETELQDVLLKHSRSRASSGRLWIFIDAVDEAGENMTRELLDYFAQLVRPSDKERGAHSTVGVCISCRRDSPLTADIPLQLRVEDSNGVDIGTYVRGELLPPPSQLTLEETERLCCYIEKKASNVFLWAFLAVEMVRGDCADLTLDQIQQRIEAMPHDLEEVYAQKIQSVSEVDRHDCLRLLQWVCFSNRPLTLPELRIALVLDPNRQEKSLQDCYDARDYVHDDELLESTMFQRSRGLLQVIPRSSLAAGDREQRVVQPVHRSVKEFLVQRGIDILCKWPVGTASRSSDLFLSRACLKYIEFPEYHETNPTSQPFATYVTFNWYLHAENAEKHGANQRDLLHLLHTRSGEMNLRTWWTNLGRATQEEPEFLDDRLAEALAEQRAEDFTIFHLAAACGLFSTIGAALVSISKVLTEDHILDDSMDESKRTLLHWAAFSGNEDMVEFFSSRKDVNTEAADKRGQTALHIAVIRGHVKIVARLLKKMPHAVNHRDEDGRAAIHYAAILGHEPILELLLAENSVDVNATDSNMQTPLSASVKAGKEGVVRLFLTRADLNMNIRGKGERSVLHSAVIQRKEAIVRLLLGRLDLDVNMRDSDKYTPLMTAVKMENVLMVRLLLGRKDVDVNAKREGNYGALLTAVSIGSDAVVGALLERPDLDMNSRGERWRTPVSIAVHMGNEAIVRLLLTRQDTDVNARDEDGSTPLLDAAYGGNVAIVQLLFGRKDTDIHGRSISGATLLSIAEQTGNKATIELVRGRLQV